MHKELKQSSLRKKNIFFSIPASECYFREARLHRPESYILPMWPVRPKQAHFCVKGRFFSSGNAGLSFVWLLFLPSSFQSERSEVRVTSDTVGSRSF